ncbi:LuxR C-terminal-related transcriptional regulator [Thiohalorhabdus methylotrophus]|uniref:LuxR C-terminal-related transcriptional regulator n=1 Tax=Thiohalorhabdus methylotrophus TaxID=3242694 RepID=A0ABV4TSE9_9GAMM
MKILLVDDHLLFREGMRHLLLDLEERPEILEASSCEEALEYIALHPDIDIGLLAPDLPCGDNDQALRYLAGAAPTIPWLGICGAEDQALMTRMFEAGARGYVPKTSSRRQMIQAIEQVHAGGFYSPPALAGPVLLGELAEEEAPRTREEAQHLLSPRQREVLNLVARGLPNRLIADELGVAEGTIRIHVSAILKAMKVRTRGEAVFLALQKGWVAS